MTKNNIATNLNPSSASTDHFRPDPTITDSEEQEYVDESMLAMMDAMGVDMDPHYAEMMEGIAAHAADCKAAAAAEKASQADEAPITQDLGSAAGSSANSSLPDILQLYPSADPSPAKSIFKHSNHGQPTAIYVYRDARAAPLFVAARYEVSPAGAGRNKTFLPWSHGLREWTDKKGQRQTKRGWHCKAPPAPSPLYGLDRLAKHASQPVIIVEGEKAADAATQLFPDFVAVCWQGGSKAVGKADWSPLKGRVAIIWPDADAPGHEAAKKVASAVLAVEVDSVAIVSVPMDWPRGWDLADVHDAEKVQPPSIDIATLKAMLECAVPVTNVLEGADRGTTSLDADIGRISELSDIDYETQRRELAVQHGVRVTRLDVMRTKARNDSFLARSTHIERPEFDSTNSLPPFLISEHNLPATAAELAAIVGRLPNIFDRHGPSQIVWDRAKNCHIIKALNFRTLEILAHSAVQPIIIEGEGENARPKPITLPDRVAQICLEHHEAWKLRPLNGLSTAPILRADGSIHCEEGYDSETRLWCQRIPDLQLPNQPSRAEAEAALLQLRQHFSTFPFADAQRIAGSNGRPPTVDLESPPGFDESAFMVALLTAVCRPSLWLAPGLLITAPQFSGAGTGKGLLVRSLCAIAYGHQPTAITSGETPQELDKRITSMLMEAISVLFLDNFNNAKLKSDLLASCITERPAAVRRLGVSETVLLNPTTFIVATGNGLVPSEDMARRMLEVKLDAGVEDPEARDFSNDIVAYTSSKRADLLQAILVIWRWGRQQGADLRRGRPLGSFIQWADWCRDPLIALGCKDPVERIAQAKAKDPERLALAEIFQAWSKHHGETAMLISELAQPVRDLIDPAGKGRQFVTHTVGSLDGTRFAGFVLVRIAKSAHWSTHRYALKRTPAEAFALPWE